MRKRGILYLLLLLFLACLTSCIKVDFDVYDIAILQSSNISFRQTVLAKFKMDSDKSYIKAYEHRDCPIIPLDWSAGKSMITMGDVGYLLYSSDFDFAEMDCIGDPIVIYNGYIDLPYFVTFVGNKESDTIIKTYYAKSKTTLGNVGLIDFSFEEVISGVIPNFETTSYAYDYDNVRQMPMRLYLAGSKDGKATVTEAIIYKNSLEEGTPGFFEIEKQTIVSEESKYAYGVMPLLINSNATNWDISPVVGKSANDRPNDNDNYPVKYAVVAGDSIANDDLYKYHYKEFASVGNDGVIEKVALDEKSAFNHFEQFHDVSILQGENRNIYPRIYSLSNNKMYKYDVDINDGKIKQQAFKIRRTNRPFKYPNYMVKGNKLFLLKSSSDYMVYGQDTTDGMTYIVSYDEKSKELVIQNLLNKPYGHEDDIDSYCKYKPNALNEQGYSFGYLNRIEMKKEDFLTMRVKGNSILTNSWLIQIFKSEDIPELSTN